MDSSVESETAVPPTLSQENVGSVRLKNRVVEIKIIQLRKASNDADFEEYHGLFVDGIYGQHGDVEADSCRTVGRSVLVVRGVFWKKILQRDGSLACVCVRFMALLFLAPFEKQSNECV